MLSTILHMFQAEIVCKNSMLKILFIFLFTITIAMAQKRESIIVTGDSLVGRIVNGESIREIYGNVVLTQGNVRITCNKAVQFILRNDAELIGNVIVTQENLTITTERGFYYGNLRKAESKSKIKLDDKKVILTADIGDYYFNEDRAYFQDNVTLYDTVSTLTSNALNYYKNEDRAVATGKVKIVDAENVIIADTIEHFRSSKITIGDGRVRISNFKNNVVILGEHLEDYAKKKYTLINRNPLLIQIDTNYTKKVQPIFDTLTNVQESLAIDTLIIRALVMESFRDTANIFIAKDSVKILRGIFASKNDYTIYFKDEEKIITKKLGAEFSQPILWYENSQITGDSILVFLRENKIRALEILKNSFIHSFNEIYRNRFDQISGERILIDFIDGLINKAEIYEGVYAIYYLYENELPNGLTKSSAQYAVIHFDDSKVSEVRLFGAPTSDYYPENLVGGNENTFLLPQYILHLNRPNKIDLLQINVNVLEENL